MYQLDAARLAALTTKVCAPSSAATFSASSTEKAASPCGTGTAKLRSTALAWYS
jgi:hypothetical protein